MDFPDRSNYFQLQEHLTRRPNLRPAVMVGAGMSKNSRPRPGVRTTFPSWDELSRAMFDEIYPLPTNATEEQLKKRENKFVQKSALRIASEYEARFERGQLDDFLLKSIPNDDHQPGILHELLLDLPWKDVFTTNFDTLLEDTHVHGRSYQSVQSINDLATSASPRIIKLHGPFSSPTSFIITEEDYRTYPRQFAPFVNTVRQSLIENAFVLIGFSGDDPNFLEWIGWIRDELGNRHAPIYLVGLLALTNVDRALLAKRRVTPIDLTPISEEVAATDHKHIITLEWFLRGLQAVEPQRPEKWPEFSLKEKQVAGVSLPVLVKQVAEPETVKSLIDSKDPIDEETAIKVIVRWRHERITYPGWLVPTNEMRSSLWQNTRLYIPGLIQIALNWSHVDQVLLFREMVWRIETSMIPLDVSLMEPFEAAHDGLFSSLINGSRLNPSDKMAELLNVSDTDVSESWLEITFALLRDARESFDAAQWGMLNDRVSQVIHRCPQYNDNYLYEQALWLMWNLERFEARNLLTQWVPSPHSPLALMWKAGLLLELEDFGESRSLLRSALEEIRQSFHRTQEENIDLLSLEGWCTYILMPVEFEMFFQSFIQNSQYQEYYSNTTDIHEQFLKRWHQLKAWDSDPWPFVEYFDRVLAGEPPPTQENEQVIPGFDLGHYSVRRSLFEGPNTKWLPAFSCLRMLERVGIPPRLLNHTVRNLAKWLSPVSDFWSAMLLVRAGNTRAVKEGDFANRTQIAIMEPDLANNLNTWAVNALSRELSLLNGSIPNQSAQVILLETLIEFVSRLTLKHGRDELHDAFSMALGLHNLSGIKAHDTLNESCGPWFKRLFDAADGQQLLAWLPELIRFSLSVYADENENAQHSDIFWPDPMTVFPVDAIRDLQEVDLSNRAKIHAAIEWLLHKTQATEGETRRRALMRLFYVFHTKVMTGEQEKHFGDLLWEHSIEDGLPELPGLALLNYLHLPSPHEIDPESRVKQHLLAMKPYKSVSIDGPRIRVSNSGDREDRMIHEVSSASKPVVLLPSETRGEIDWDKTEVSLMWKLVYDWWENDKHAIKHVNNNPGHKSGFEEFARHSIKRIGMFLSRVVLPHMETAKEEDWKEILSLLSETRRDRVFLTQAMPYILLHRPSEHNVVLETIRDDLSSGDKEAVNAAAVAISHWAYLGDETDVERVPNDAVNDLIRRVVFRRPEGIRICLRRLAMIVGKKSDLIDSDQIDLVVSSLTPWHEATRIPIPENDSGGFPEHDRPLLRALLGQLASALSTWKKIKQPYEDEPAEIAALRELFSSDPLPEVRRSFGNS